MSIDRIRGKAMDKFKIHFTVANESTSTAFETFDETLQDGLMKIPDIDQRKEIGEEFTYLQKRINKTISKLQEKSLSELKQAFPIKLEVVDLCEDEFSIR